MGAIGWLEAELVAPPAMRAGDGADVHLVLRSSSESIEGVEVSVHGLAGAHLGLPAGRVVLRPGIPRQLTARLQLPTSATPGTHQLVLELRRQLDPDNTRLVPFEVDVLPAPVPVVSLRRTTLRRRARIRVENPSDEPIQVALTGSVGGAAFRFEPTVLDLEPGASSSARVKVVSRGRFGRRPATLGAATANASATVDATVVGKSRFGPFVAAGAALVALVVAVAMSIGGSGGDPATDLASDERPAGGDGGTTNGSGTGTGTGSTVNGPAGPAGPGVSSGSGGTAGPGDTATGGTIAGEPGSSGSLPGGGVAPSGDCTTEDGSVAWALRGRVLANGVASVSARPAGQPPDAATVTTTDQGGFFSFCPIELGDYLVTALAEGYYPLVVPARVTGSTADLGELELRPGAASLIGVVEGPDGPLEGALVIVREGRREVGRGRTDERGEYLVHGIPAPADVTVEVSAAGLATTSFEANVRADGRIRQEPVTLTEA